MSQISKNSPKFKKSQIKKKCSKSSRLSKILEMYPTYYQRYILHTHGLSAEGAKAIVKQMQTLDDHPHFKI